MFQGVGLFMLVWMANDWNDELYVQPWLSRLAMELSGEDKALVNLFAVLAAFQKSSARQFSGRCWSCLIEKKVIIMSAIASVQGYLSIPAAEARAEGSWFVARGSGNRYEVMQLVKSPCAGSSTRAMPASTANGTLSGNSFELITPSQNE
ncbi:hypothetical protein FNU76_10770 [Chitinimonas arctica]|uniref:Uncharacterized protein n=1 Tax=Chitinimonas arctica TaxID=2594795 RepID=A0A516SFK3_9NEIS|nr:hypothetical protein [Chitinimonas arctica]QDQ26808.1 hypothetical protein FNU76_10770 [Chitinimonas arctica]